ncbi:hypothetical protein MMC12_005192 [Toensbergia leucococca]|nr:hypothetical protein [Toensbergia leucococca]
MPLSEKDFELRLTEKNVPGAIGLSSMWDEFADDYFRSIANNAQEWVIDAILVVLFAGWLCFAGMASFGASYITLITIIILIDVLLTKKSEKFRQAGIRIGDQTVFKVIHQFSTKNKKLNKNLKTDTEHSDKEQMNSKTVPEGHGRGKPSVTHQLTLTANGTKKSHSPTFQHQPFKRHIYVTPQHITDRHVKL